jgi:hypothetical protein
MGDRVHSWLLIGALGCAVLGWWLAFVIVMALAAVNIGAVFAATREDDTL